MSSLVAAPRRRRVLERLIVQDGSMALSDLAAEAAAAERGSVADEIPTVEAKLVYLDLYHSHVPKLAEAGVVEYDRELDVVEPTVDAERAAACPSGG